MKVTPRYTQPPPIVFDGDQRDVFTPLERQRTRFEAMVRDLSDDEWRAPSRCADWTVQDVIAHLAGVNDYWTFSITAGVAGTPTEVLAAFDPVAVPAALVDATRSSSRADVAEKFAASNDRLLATLAALDDDGWTAIAECPPGHVTVGVVAHNALWDCWVHEHDIGVPLHREIPVEQDEVLASLRFAAAISAAFAMLSGRVPQGVLGIDVTDPDAAFVVEIGDSVTVRRDDLRPNLPRLHGDALAVLEAVSTRAPIPGSTPAAWRTVLAGLHEAFEQPLG